MDTASYSFSACSDGSVSYTITCTGPDCDPLGELFGNICSSSGDTVTCSYNNCTGPVDYISTSQISVSNSTFYAVNDLSLNDGADVSFVVNGTNVLPFVTLSSSVSSTTSNSTTSASQVSTSTSSTSSRATSNGSLSSLAGPSTTPSNQGSTSSYPLSSTSPPSVTSSSLLSGSAGSSGVSSSQGAPITHSSSSTTAIQPNGESSLSTTSSSTTICQTSLPLPSSSPKIGVSAAVESASTPSGTLITHSSSSSSQSTVISSSISTSVIPPPATSPSSALTSHGVTNSSPLTLASTQSSSKSAPTSLSPLPPNQSSAYVAVQQSTGQSSTTITVAPPLASTQTLAAGSTSSSLTTSAANIQIQSSGASRSKRSPAGFASFLPILLLLLSLMTPAATTASGQLYSNPLVNLQSPSPFHERSNAISPVPLDRKALITPGSFVGPAIGDASTWVKQFTNFFCDNQPNLSSDLITLGTDILDLVCQVVISDLETDINREILFKQAWNRCVALGETKLQEVQQSVYGPNNTNPLGTGLGGHYLTVGFTFAATAGIKAGCDILFAKLLQWKLGVNPVNQACDAFLDSLGLIPPDQGTPGCPSLTGGCSCSSGGSGGGGGGGDGGGDGGSAATSAGSGGQQPTTTASAPASSSSAPSCPTAPGWKVCNGECLNTLYDNNNCLDCGSVCPDGGLCCDGECYLPDSEEVCGSCNVTCYDGTCTNGVCITSNTPTCLTGWDNCNGDCADLLADSNNCGTCGHACTGGALCSDGYCLDCASNAPDPCGALGCVDLDNDLNNCGNCGNKCPSSDNYCFDGACKFCDLAAGYGICLDGVFSDVDCYDLQTDSDNCAKCGNICSEESPFCVDGSCTAQAPL